MAFEPMAQIEEQPQDAMSVASYSVATNVRGRLLVARSPVPGYANDFRLFTIGSESQVSDSLL